MLETLHAFVSGFDQVFVWSTLALMLLGIAIGFVVGILPGLGGPTTLALMLPFIYKMSAVEAFAFLLGMTAVTATTGDITSVLFGVPGEPTSAATIIDGHPMAKSGQAGRALGAVLMSSLIGAVFGAFALAMAVPFVRPLVLVFGSPELFMLALLGVTFVVGLSGDAVVKGLISAGMGFFLATIGVDPISGTQRYTFGALFLWDGIGLVPVAVGLFAIPEIIELGINGGTIAHGARRIGGVMDGIKDTFRHIWLVLRCSAIGAYLGVIPGFGAGVSQWISYAHAVHSSNGKERFGHGAIEGVLGPGAANNSSTGGTLIPTIAFGVPGSLSMAILLGAFIIQGIVPGPEMLIPEPSGHLSLTFSFVWIIVVSNVVAVAVCLLFLNQLAKITSIRSGLLMPFILLLIFLGAFAEKNAFADMIVVLIFGALGWIMVILKWPRPPLLLGLVLGPLMENRLFLSADNYGAAWLLRPGVVLIFLIALAGIIYPILKRRRWRIVADLNRPSSSRESDNTAKRLHKYDGVFAFILITALICALWDSRHFGFRAGLFPWAIGFPLLGLSFVQAVISIRGKNRFALISGGSGSESDGDSALSSSAFRRRMFGISVWIVGFFVGIWLLGFPLAFPLLLFLYLRFGAGEKWSITIATTLFGSFFFYALFQYALAIPFPKGALVAWLA